MISASCGTRGFALIEVTVSLLLVSLGTLGLAGMQLAATRASFEAMQRSNATAAAMDIVENMRANSSALPHYALADGQRPPATESLSHCHTTTCSPPQLATYELWNWWQILEGSGQLEGDLPVGGLVKVRPCIRVSGHIVEVVIAWQGLEPVSPAEGYGWCGSGLGDTRQLLVLRAYIGERTDGAE